MVGDELHERGILEDRWRCDGSRKNLFSCLLCEKELHNNAACAEATAGCTS